MTFLLYLSNVLCASGQSALGKLNGRRGGSNTHFNLAKASAAVLLFLLSSVFGFTFHTETLLYGIAYGVFFSVSTVAGLAALTSGPMALTSVIVSFSLVIPCLYGIVLLDERLSPLGVIGLVLLAASIILLRRKSSGQLSARWWMLTLLTLLANGLCSVVQKLHQTAYPKLYQREFMLWATLVVLVFLFISTLCRRGASSSEAHEPSRVSSLLPGAGAGVLNGAALFISLSLAASESAVILFPILGASTAVASFLIGRFFFGERISRLQLLGLALGIASVVLLKL